MTAACWEDPPLFSSEIAPVVEPGIAGGIARLFGLWSRYFGDQWSIGDWDGYIAAIPRALDEWQVHIARSSGVDEPPQNLREYDPEWGKAFLSGSFLASCPHHVMLSQVKVPVLFTHHFRMTDEATGALMGACAEAQAERAVALVRDAGQSITYRSFPMMGHSMHGQDPALYAETLTEWFGGFAS